MTTPIAHAVATKSGDDLVKFLAEYPYPEPEEPEQTDSERYMDLMDPDPGYTPGTLSEVRHLANTGALDWDTYMKFLAAYEDEQEDPNGDAAEDDERGGLAIGKTPEQIDECRLCWLRDDTEDPYSDARQAHRRSLDDMAERCASAEAAVLQIASPGLEAVQLQVELASERLWRTHFDGDVRTWQDPDPPSDQCPTARGLFNRIEAAERLLRHAASDLEFAETSTERRDAYAKRGRLVEAWLRERATGGT